MAKPKIYVTRQIFPQAIERLKEATDVEQWDHELPPSRDILLSKVPEIDGLYCLLTDKIDSELFNLAPNLKIVSNMAVGFDNIDVSEATKRGIPVGNTPGVLTETTADFAFGLMMAAGRRIAEGDRYTRSGKWKTWGPMVLLGQDIHQSTMGIIGFGRIGMELAKRAQGFGMNILYYDIVRNETGEKLYNASYCPDLEDLLAQSDFVSVHVNLTPETHHLINSTTLSQMKSTSVLVNTSRGPVIDQKALYNALKNGIIAFAGLDVTETEPIAMDDPLLTLENIIIAPHIASASVATRTKMSLMAVDNLLAGLKGELPPNCPNPEAMVVKAKLGK